MSYLTLSYLDFLRTVSYESDHVYTFPIFPDASAAGPTLTDIDGDEKKSNKPVPELAAYGGHLNRLTFLKSAKYAGPNDECECLVLLAMSAQTC